MMEPTWLAVARKYDGEAEIPGTKSNPLILKAARAIGAPSWYDNDDQPWCAVAQNAWLLESKLKMALGQRGDPFDRLRALTFFTDTEWGQTLSGPALGAIAVFTGPTHVGMYLGEQGQLLRIYGGNQRNRVCATWIKRNRLKGYFWPRGVPLPTVGPIMLAANGEPVSTSER